MNPEDVIDKCKDIFVDEAKENIDRLNNLLIQLEKNLGNNEIVDEIFRVVHLLKGSSAVLNITPIVELTHNMEEVLSRIRNKEKLVTPKIVDIFFEVVDNISLIVDAFSKGEKTNLNVDENLIRKLKEAAEEEYKLKNEFINQVANILGEEEIEHVKHAMAQGFKLYLIKTVVAKGSPLASVKAFTVLQKLEEKGDVIVTIPNGSEISKSGFKGEMVILVAYNEIEELKKILKDEVDVQELYCMEVNPQSLGIPIQQPEGEKKKEDKTEDIEHLIKKVETFLQEKRSATFTGKDLLHGLKHVDEVKVKVKDIDKLLTLIGELVLIRNRFLRVSKEYHLQALRDAVASLNQATNELYSEILKIRLTPIEQVFNIFPRFVRDLSKNMGKQVDLIVDCGEVALDKSIIEELTDPLVGLIRNAIDHGIETPDERRAAGKPSVGTLKLLAKREGELVAITVEDDGRGIDVELIKKIVVEKSLIPKSTVEKLSNQEILMLTCLPGFSTKKSTSLVSGRGIGLNAIKQRVEAIGGYIEIDSEKGKGTRVTLLVPTTVTVLTVLLVNVGDEIYAIPSSIISSAIKLNMNSIRYTGREGIILYKGRLIPIYSLSNMLGVSDKDESYAVILQKGDKLYGITVSSILGFEDVVVKYGGILSNIPWISGVTILSNEEVTLIVDPLQLIGNRQEV